MVFNPEKKIEDLPQKEFEEAGAASATESEIEPEDVFDMERMVTDEDWERIKRNMNHKKNREDVWHYLEAAKNIKTFSPEDFQKNELGREKHYDRALEIVEEEREEGRWPQAARDAAAVKILSPDKLSEADVNRIFEGAKEQIMLERKGNRPPWPSLLATAEDLVILSPERRGELGLDDEMFEQIKKEIEEVEEKKCWDVYADRLARAMILFPERAKEFKLSGQALNGMNEKFEQLRRGADFYKREDLFSKMARDMKIISAKKMETTEKGIETK